MSDPTRDEMRARFDQTVPEPDDAHDTDDSENTKDAKDSKDSEDADNSKGADNSKASQSSNDTSSSKPTSDSSEEVDDDITRKRKQYVMYLPSELHDELNSLYRRYDAIAKLEGDDGVSKHKQFLEAVVREGLDSSGLDERIGVDTDEFE